MCLLALIPSVIEQAFAVTVQPSSANNKKKYLINNKK